VWVNEKRIEEAATYAKWGRENRGGRGKVKGEVKEERSGGREEEEEPTIETRSRDPKMVHDEERENERKRKEKSEKERNREED
jgi:hypothetical protein